MQHQEKSTTTTTTQQYGNERLYDSKNFTSSIQCDRNLFIMDCTPLRM